MKFYFPSFFLSLLTFSLAAQNLYFEPTNGITGQLDVVPVLVGGNSLRTNIATITEFDPSDGWELVAVDHKNYYYQATDTSRSTYGQIAYWDSEANSRVNYGELSAIFDDPTNWTLGGVDDGILYFSSGATNAEIVSWDGAVIESFAFFKDFLGAPEHWELAGFYQGELYVQWIHPSDQSISVRTWNGSAEGTRYDVTDYYTNYTDAYLCGVSSYIPSSAIMVSSLDKIKQHVLETKTLSSEQLLAQQSIISAYEMLFRSQPDIMAQGFAIVSSYESKYGGLFTNGSTTEGGIRPRTASGYELENVMMTITQALLDHTYSAENLVKYPSLFENVKFETSSFFPGAVPPPSDENVSYTIKIDGKHIKSWGTPALYETEDARRPTGCYLAPGSVATVSVPTALVGIGASVLVGAHTWDHSTKPNIKRMDRVTKKYELTNETITIANPLGGGIYINVPFEYDLGTLSINLRNVVRSPYYANTNVNKTTLSEWQNVERLREAPWTDFESNKVMMQVPTAWIYALDDPITMMEDWDLSMDAISESLGRPLVRSKTVVYSQVDVQPRGSANFPGYPQANLTYKPLENYNGNHDNLLVSGPRNARGYVPTVFFHELGHAERIYKFNGEGEALVNFLFVAVHNKVFGVELNEAFSESFFSLNHTIDEAAISWMIAENFRNGMPMSITNGDYLNEMAYQPRGYAKYAEIVRLFGWEALEKFYYNLNESYENGTYPFTGNVNNVPTDGRVLRMSIASGYDMRPLLHFWGKHPDDPQGLAAAIASSGVKKSTAIYDQLMYYKTIVPENNEAFRAFGLEDFSESKIVEFNNTLGHKIKSYNEGFLNSWWDDYTTTAAAAAVAQVQAIIDLYFPEGRPEVDHKLCNQLVPIGVTASSYEAGSTNLADNTLDGNPQSRWSAKGDGEFIVYDLGAIYDLCTIDIDFHLSLDQYTYFDLEVSRDGQTFATVFQGISNTKTTEFFDSYSVSRTARYVKIIGRGNENNTWNSIEEIAFYYNDEVILTTNEPQGNLANLITVYPIPTTDQLFVSGVDEEIKTAAIYDLEGTLLQTVAVEHEGKNLSIAVSEYANGIYFLRLISSKTTVVKKFVIGQ